MLDRVLNKSLMLIPQGRKTSARYSNGTKDLKICFIKNGATIAYGQFSAWIIALRIIALRKIPT